MQGTLQPQLEQRVIARKGARGRVRRIDDLADGRIIDASRPAGHGKLVVHLRVRKGVQSEAPIAAEVMDLRRLMANEDLQATVGNDRADRMDARPAVLADRGQIAEPDADLVDEHLSRLGHVGLFG